MKRFISALSSFCLAATSVLSAFSGLTASAAAGSITIKGDEVSATAGQKVEFGFKVTEASDAAGMQLFFDFDGLQNVEMVSDLDNPAYFVDATFNPAVGSFVWGGAQNQPAELGGDLVIFTATVPSNAKSTYEVKLNSSETNAVRNRDMEDLSINFTPAVISVAGGTTVDKMSIAGEKISAKPGQSVKVGFKVTDDPGTAGMQLFFNFDGLQNVTMADNMDNPAYFVDPTFNAAVGSFVWGGAQNEICEDGGYLVIFDVTIPASAKDTYTISLNSAEKNAVRNRDMQDVDYSFTPAVITVTGGSEPIEGAMNITGEKITAKPGDTVNVGFKVTDDPGTAGMQFFFDFDGLQNVKMADNSDTPAYFIDPTFNPEVGSFVWGGAQNEICDEGGYLVIFEVTVPASAKGSLSIDLNRSEKNAVRNRDMQDVIYNFTPAVITIESEPIAGAMNITGEKITAKPGDTVNVGFTVTDDPGTAGMQLFFDFDGLKNVKMADNSDTPAYFIDPTFNPEVGSFVWGGAQNEICDEGGYLVIFEVTIPENAKSSYTVSLNGSEKNAVRNRDMQDVVYNFFDAVITVAGGSDVPTDGMRIIGENVTAPAGSTVKVGCKVYDDPGTAGMQLFFDFDGLKNVKMADNSDTPAYFIDPTFNPEVGSFVWGGAQNEICDEGGYLVIFEVTVPENGSGIYEITLNPSEKNAVRNRDMKDVSYSYSPMTITVGEPLPPVDGKIVLTGDQVNAEAGETVQAAIKISGDPGTAGMQMFFDFGDLENVKVVESENPAYLIDYTVNLAEGFIGFGTATSQTAADGSELVVFSFTVPADAKAGDAFVVDLNKSAENMIQTLDMQDIPFSYSPIEITVGATTTTTTTSTEPVVPAGKSEWTIDTVTAAPSDIVSVPVKVTGDEGTSGFVVSFDYKEGLTFTGFEWGTGYTGEATLNGKELTVVWAEADGKDAVAGDAPVLYLNFETPAAAGVYPVSFAALEVVNTSGNALNITKTNGAVIIDPNAQPTAKSEWTIGTVNVQPGADVSVPVKVENDEGTSGFVVTFDYDEALTFKDIVWGEGYSGEATINGNALTVVWADNSGDNAQAGSADVMTINFTAPDEVGTYPVTFADLEVVDTNGNPLNVTKENGAVIVSTEPITPPGKATWTIDTETVEKGAKVALPVTVTGDEGTSGFVVTFDYDEALTFDGFTWGEGYTGEATLNGKELTVVWAEAEGKDAVAGDAPVLYLNFTAPDEVGTYPVIFRELEVVNTSGNALEVTEENGAVIVSAEPVVPAGKSNWTIGKETVAKGADVSVPVTVTDDEGTSGFVVTFDYDEALTFEGFTWGEGYTGEATLNGKELTVVWAEADGNDAIAEDAPVLYLNFTAPDEVGEYPVTFADLEVVNTSGNALDVTMTDGAVIVVDEVTTTSTSDTTTEAIITETTPIESIGSDDSTITTTETTSDGGTTTTTTETTSDGGTTTTTTETTSDGGTTTTTTETTSDGGTTTTTTETTSDGGTTTTTTETTSDGGTTTTTTETTGQGGSSDVDTTTTTTETTVSGGTTTTTETTSDGGTTTTTTETTGQGVSSDIDTTTTTTETTVSGGTTTTTETTPDGGTTTTTETTTGGPIVPGEGKADWSIADVSAQPGALIRVPVYVTGDTGTAGFVVSFDHDDALKLEGFAWGDGYTGDATINQKELTVVWDDNEGKNQIAGDEPVMYLLFTVPDAEGKYPVTFKSVEATDENGNALTITTKDGSVSVSKTATTETTVSTDTTESGNTTTTISSDIGNVTTESTGSDDVTGTTTTTTSKPDDVTGTTTTTTSKPDDVTGTTTTTTSKPDDVTGTTTTTTSKPDDVTGTTTTTTSKPDDVTGTTTTTTSKPDDVTGTTTTTTSKPDDVTGTTTTTTSKPDDVTGTTTTTTSKPDDVTGTTTTTTETTGQGGSSDVDTTTTTTTTETTVSGGTTTTTETTSDGGTTTTTTETTSDGGTTTTTETTVSGGTTTTIVTSVVTSFTPPTRVYYWSHDGRPLSVSGGLADMAASLTVMKYYQDADGNIVDAEGNITDQPFETKSLDISQQTNPMAELDSPLELYASKEHPVEKYDPELHMYPVDCYFTWDETMDPDFNIGNGEPVYMGEFTIYIGLKGDTDLNEIVTADDANEVLHFYLCLTVFGDEYYELNSNEYLQELAFYLSDVSLPMGMDNNIEVPGNFSGKNNYYVNITADDASAILNYYLRMEVFYGDLTPEEKDEMFRHNLWVDLAGQDFLDEYYEAHYPNYPGQEG